MQSNRRRFLASSFAAVAAGALVTRARSAPRWEGEDEADSKLDVLILGGTGLIGPALVEAARSRGHRLTLFNRGRTRPEMFPEVEKLRGNRDPNTGEGLKALEGRKFDVVFDDCGYVPRHVRASAELLAPNVSHYVFVSSISAYKDGAPENSDESAPLAEIADPTAEDPNGPNYGPLKVLCEKAAEAACPGRTTVLRAGFIVGPEDRTNRFTWWPVRVQRGGEVLVPGEPTDPIQVIDVRDLAEWMVRIAENKTFGIFNACGPKERLTMRAMLEASKEVTKSDATFTWVPTSFLRSEGVDVDGMWPIWTPYEGETKGFHTWSNVAAVKAGLEFRSIGDTIEGTLAYYETLPPAGRIKNRGPLTVEFEEELLEKWHARDKDKGS